MESFRKLMQSWAGKTFLAVVLFVFVVFAFIPSINMPGSRGEVAEVGGEPISAQQLDAAVERARARFGDQVDPAMLDMLVSRETVLDGLIRQKAMVLQAQGLDLVASPRVLGEAVQQNPMFQDGSGKFSPERYRQVLRENGIPNPAAYLEQVQAQVAMEQLGSALFASAFATRGELEVIARAAGQKRDVAYVILPVSDYLAGIEVSDAEVQARYDANPAGYMTEEQFSFNYVEVDAKRFEQDVEVGEDDVRAAHAARVAQANLNAERRIAHILVAVNDQRDEAAARARAGEVQAKLAAGGDFADLAREYSDDTGSAQKGGELGFIGRGALDGGLEAAVFALGAGGVTPAPVKSPDGFHLARVLEVRGTSVAPLEALRAELVAEVRRNRALEQYHALLDGLTDKVYEADDLAGPAADLGLPVLSTPLFAAGKGEGIAANPKVLQALRSPDVLEDGRNSGVLDLGDGHAVVLHLKEHRKPVRRPLAEVAAGIRADLRFEKAGQVAAQKAETMRAAVQGGQSLDAIAATGSLPVMRVPGATRQASSMPGEVLKAAFRLKPPAAGQSAVGVAKLDNGGSVLFTVANVVDGNLLGLDPQQLAGQRSELASMAGRSGMAAYIAWAVASHDVKRFADAEAGKTP